MKELTIEDKIAIDEVRAFANLTEGEVITMFKAFCDSYATFQYHEDKTVTIPFVGEFKFSYDGEEIVGNKRESKISCKMISIHNNLKKAIEAVEDIKETPEKIKELPSYGCLRNKIRRELRTS